MPPKKKKQLVPKEEPLFISFLNSSLTKSYISDLLSRLERLFTEASDKLAARDFREELKDHHMEGYKLTQTKFRDQIDHIIKFGSFDKEFGSWANFYLSSLREFRKEDVHGNEERFVRIGDPNGDWITGLILYNFSLFSKYYGHSILKMCPSCSNYFTTKGKYAKFCSDECKKHVSSQKQEELD